ncbi:hypothetical protein DFP72DRAFT_895352 [Ephemerocybe angulata]|uniref:ENTH domain-containing protein n=1 Tax=Ephemerocybe angulata TaxID=980116 RepID=A0A8H6M7H9_9AGAR|nr:hypothetical protein DFP72DRAFT_895352 [Tulosesus angulatus]
MDKIESLSTTLSALTMYDIKSMYTQAKNVVLNISEMEAKVREATNDDPWGASSTLMGEISQGTFNFAHFNEIMPCIYARFMEKEARQWRQIYKALVLLEYLIKNGSERVVDDARSHISTIKMLRNFHYIDDKGKDEGINVRNRSKELVELLTDVEKIRSERRKAKANKNKFTGVGNDAMGFSGGSAGRYGGFGSDSFTSGGGGGGGGSGSDGGYANDHYGSGAGSYSGGGPSYNYNDHNTTTTQSRRQFEEYDAGGDDLAHNTSSTPARASTSHRNPSRKASVPVPVPAPAPPPPAPVEDLLGDFGDDAFGSSVSAPAPPATNKALPAVTAVSLDDDDFADFQAAPVQQAPVAQAKPNLLAMLNSSSPPPRQPSAPSFGQAQPPPGYGAPLGGFTNAHRPSPSLSSQGGFASPTAPSMQPMQSQNLFGGAAPLRPTATSQASFGNTARPASTPAAAPAKPASANFDDLWSLGLGASTSKPATPVAGTKSIQALQKEKAQASIWGAGGQKQPQPAQFGGGAFGSFGTSTNAGASAGGDDDLLL